MTEIRQIRPCGWGGSLLPACGCDTTAHVTLTLEPTDKRGDDMPVWFWDTDYNELAFCAGQAFFQRTAWDNLKRELRGVYADSVWEHRAGTVSEPFAAGEHRQIAVKVIDDRGNELLVVKKLEEAEQKG